MITFSKCQVALNLFLHTGRIVELLLSEKKLRYLSNLSVMFPEPLEQIVNIIFSNISSHNSEKENHYDLCCAHGDLHSIISILSTEFPLLSKEFMVKQLSGDECNNDTCNKLSEPSLWTSYLKYSESFSLPTETFNLPHSTSLQLHIEEENALEHKDIDYDEQLMRINSLQKLFSASGCSLWSLAIALVSQNKEALQHVVYSPGNCLSRSSLTEFIRNSSLPKFDFFLLIYIVLYYLLFISEMSSLYSPLSLKTLRKDELFNCFLSCLFNHQYLLRAASTDNAC